MIFDRAGIPHVAWRSAHRCDISSLDAFADQMEKELGYPMFIKPAKTGLVHRHFQSQGQGYLYKSV